MKKNLNDTKCCLVEFFFGRVSFLRNEGKIRSVAINVSLFIPSIWKCGSCEKEEKEKDETQEATKMIRSIS